MKNAILLGILVFISVCAVSLLVSKPAPPTNLPQFTNGDELVRPQNYREWVFISSGFHLSNSMSPTEGATFMNVFVNPSAYQQFLISGNWPDSTILVEEIRKSSSEGPVNKTAQFQSDLTKIAVKVKAPARFPDQWAYYSFDSSARTAKPNPKAACWQCHHDHGGVDSTYVQF